MAVEFKDYYKIMGLSPQASQEEIKHAYRKLARKYHPDVSHDPDAEAKFKELGEAYEALKDKKNRAKYDALRQQGWRDGERFSAAPQWQQGFNFQQASAGAEATANDFFEAIFGHQATAGGWRRHKAKHTPARGEDIHYILEIDAADSYHGSTRKIDIPLTHRTPDGRVTQTSHSMNVKIPKGILNGQQIRLKGQGGPGDKHAPSGDLYLEIRLKESAPYHLEGKDVTLYLPIAPWEAVLGTTVKVPTLGGPIEVKIPPHSQTGSKLRLKGRGLPGDPPGNQYIILQIVVQPTLTEAEKALYQQMAQETSFNPRARLGV